MAMRMRGVSFLACFLLVAGLFAPASANQKYAAFVVHANSGDVLFDKYSNKRLYPASLTKMMTLYLLFDEIEAGRLSLDSKLKVSARAAGQPPSKLGLKAGSTIDVETAINALVVKSANDVAVVVAEAIAGSEWKFAQRMTAKARSLGMRRTSFRNASGLPNRKQVSTARDMASLSRRLIQDHDKHFHFFDNKSFEWGGRTYRSHNRLVKNYDGADGMKTGYTRRSGYNLATTATRDGHRLIGVVLGGRSSRTRDAHMVKILDQSFASIKKRPALIAAMYRETPSPRLKPTLMAQLEQEKNAPSIADNDLIRKEIIMATADFAITDETDEMSALIAAADPDDFNEFERVKLYFSDKDIEQGDLGAEAPLDWHVQIGAYTSKTMAQTELEDAAAAANLVGYQRSVTPTDKDDGNTVYRARFTALDEEEAAEVCEAIRRATKACFVLQEPQLTQ